MKKRCKNCQYFIHPHTHAHMNVHTCTHACTHAHMNVHTRMHAFITFLFYFRWPVHLISPFQRPLWHVVSILIGWYSTVGWNPLQCDFMQYNQSGQRSFRSGSFVFFFFLTKELSILILHWWQIFENWNLSCFNNCTNHKDFPHIAVCHSFFNTYVSNAVKVISKLST